MADLPDWVLVLIAMTVFLVLAAFAWRWTFRSSYRVVQLAEEMLPTLLRLSVDLKDSPDAFAMLHQIITQFKTASGETLREVVTKLEQSIEKNRLAIAQLVINIEVARMLAEQDRRQFERLITLVNILEAKMEISAESNKALMKDVKAVHQRANAVPPDAAPGTAADAALKNGLNGPNGKNGGGQ